MFSSKFFGLMWKSAVVLLAALLLSLGVDAQYRRVYNLPYSWPSSVLPNPPLAEKYQIVKVGNSHAQDGITFKGYKLRGLDLTGVAQRFEFDLALLKQHANQIEEGAVILIAVTPVSFSHTAANSAKGFQSGYYGRVSPFFIPNLNWADYIEQEFLPFTRSGYLWRQKRSEQLREAIAQQEKSPDPTPSPSPVSSPQPSAKSGAAQRKKTELVRVLRVDPREYYFNVEAIEQQLKTFSPPDSYIDNRHLVFNKWYHTDEFNPEFFAANRRDLEQLIKYSLKKKWRPVLVTVPISESLRQTLYDDYMQKYLYENLAATDLQGSPYIDFSDDKRMTTNTYLYWNADHLHTRGAAIFSYLLLKELIERSILPATADGYDYGPLYITAPDN